MLRHFDHYFPNKKQPVFLEITIDNTCYLECIMCSSLLASKIANRKGYKQTKQFNNESLKKEIFDFIPGLQEVVFSGGEPFMSSLYKDIWKEIIERNPSCLISVNTNGTVLTNEYKKLMEKGNFHLNVSFDS